MHKQITGAVFRKRRIPSQTVEMLLAAGRLLEMLASSAVGRLC